jgi:hypothetical protein
LSASDTVWLVLHQRRLRLFLDRAAWSRTISDCGATERRHFGVLLPDNLSLNYILHGLLLLLLRTVSVSSSDWSSSDRPELSRTTKWWRWYMLMLLIGDGLLQVTWLLLERLLTERCSCGTWTTLEADSRRIRRNRWHRRLLVLVDDYLIWSLLTRNSVLFLLLLKLFLLEPGLRVNGAAVTGWRWCLHTQVNKPN